MKESDAREKGSIATQKRRHISKKALWVAMAFCLPSALYIVLSDYFAMSTTQFWLISPIKGILYVLLASLLVFFLTYRSLHRQAAERNRTDEALSALQRSYQQLTEQSERLQESQQWFSVLFDRTTVPFLLYTWEGMLARSNRAALSLFGVEREEELSTVRLDALLPKLSDSEDVWQRWLADFKQAGYPYTAHFEWQRPSGESFTARITISAVSMEGRDMLFAFCQDITERERTQRAVARSEEQLRVTLNSIGDGVVAADSKGRVTMVNAVAETLTGWDARQAIGRPIGDVLALLHPQDDTLREDPAAMVLKSYGIQRGRYRLQPLRGEPRQVSSIVSPILAGDGPPQGVVAVLRDIADQMQREAEILYLSYHDTLTGLYNRAFFEEERKRLDTDRQLPLSVIIGDANNLKLVNDVFGHSEGDRLICTLARVFRKCCRKEDIVCRWGGDEFVVLLPMTDGKMAERICRRIRDACRTQTLGQEDTLLLPSISLGWACKDGPGITMEQVTKNAEDMMYADKMQEGQLAFHDLLEAMNRRAQRWSSSEGTQAIEDIGLQICQALAVDEKTRQEYSRLVRLRDVGLAAVGVSGDQGELTESEREQMRRHPVIGYRIARAAPELIGIADALLSHHEWFDGTGYPQGLVGDEIPLIARILAVAETYHALVTGSAGAAPSPEGALERLYQDAGSVLDPEIVYAFAASKSALSTLPREIA